MGIIPVHLAFIYLFFACAALRLTQKYQRVILCLIPFILLLTTKQSSATLIYTYGFDSLFVRVDTISLIPAYLFLLFPLTIVFKGKEDDFSLTCLLTAAALTITFAGDQLSLSIGWLFLGALFLLRELQSQTKQILLPSLLTLSGFCMLTGAALHVTEAGNLFVKDLLKGPFIQDLCFIFPILCALLCLLKILIHYQKNSLLNWLSAGYLVLCSVVLILRC